ncbi:hypothetical protein O181_001953 [Austropuccinia psidii MF-1]|uniref:Uncharacterized protein n=1 Tax=Austropuccinia psidii MF-1 TaxID=1389203 RepID=A0A9Q3BBT9_9BASI|nr:hypothetical protein [Austropuccinia psidii MF-1]
MSPVHLRNLGVPRSPKEDRIGLFRARETGFGKNGDWQDTQGYYYHTPIHISIQQTLKARGLERYGSSTSEMFQWSMETKRFNLDSHWKKPGGGFQKISLREIYFKELMERPKGWNPKNKLKLLEEREAKIRENKATIQDIEEKSNQKENILTPSGSQGFVKQPNSPVASEHSESTRSMGKSHHFSQFQEKTRTKGQEQDFFQP